MTTIDYLHWLLQLVRHQVDVIAASVEALPRLRQNAQQRQTPIVFVVGVNPVKLGLVASLNRPGGNVTGVVNLALELGPKRLQLLRELLPDATAIAVLINRHSPVAQVADNRCTRRLGHSEYSSMLYASTDRELETLFAGLNATGL